MGHFRKCVNSLCPARAGGTFLLNLDLRGLGLLAEGSGGGTIGPAGATESDLTSSVGASLGTEDLPVIGALCTEPSGSSE